MSIFDASVVLPPARIGIAIDNIGLCVICQFNVLSNVEYVVTACRHTFHLRCFKTLYTMDLNQYLSCPICRSALERSDRGVPRPSSILPGDLEGFIHPSVNTLINQALVPGAQPVLAGRNALYLKLNRTSAYTLTHFSTRVITPLFLERITICRTTKNNFQIFLPHIYIDQSLIIETDSLYDQIVAYLFGSFQTEDIHILPAVVSELQSFWQGRILTKADFEVSIIKCRELLNNVDVESTVMLRTLIYAPIHAVMPGPQFTGLQIWCNYLYGLNYTRIFKKIVYFFFILIILAFLSNVFYY